MNTTNKDESIPENTLRVVLQEMLDEQKNTNEINTKLIDAVSRLSHKIDGIDNKMGKSSTGPAILDTKPMEGILKKSMTEIVLLISASPKTATKKFQISLFPGQHAKPLYNRLMLYFLIAFALLLFYWWCTTWQNNRKLIEIEQIRNKEISNFQENEDSAKIKISHTKPKL